MSQLTVELQLLTFRLNAVAVCAQIADKSREGGKHFSITEVSLTQQAAHDELQPDTSPVKQLQQC